MSAQLSYDSTGDGKGLILGVTPEWCRIMLDADSTLWGDSVLVDDFDSSMHTSGAQINAEVGYGLTVWEHMSLLKSYCGVLLSDSQEDKYCMGIKLTVDSGFELDLKGSQTHKGNGTENSGINLEGSVWWYIELSEIEKNCSDYPLPGGLTAGFGA